MKFFGTNHIKLINGIECLKARPIKEFVNKSFKEKKLKILHAPVNVCNQPWHISRIERQKGHTSDIIVNYQPSYGLEADIVVSQYQQYGPRDIIQRLYHVIRSLVKYDVFHFYFGKTLFVWDDYFGPRNWLWYWDLRLAKLLGKKIIMTLQGCDVRTAAETEIKYKHSACHEDRCPQYTNCITQNDGQRRWLREKIFPKIDHFFFLNPDLGRYLDPTKSSFLPYASVPISQIKIREPKITGKIKILHAPSVPTLKGTPQIIEVLEQLSARYDIELILVQNTPYADAIKLYEDADLVIDQINIGWYGAFSVEVMAMGKPVACFLREEDYKFLPQEFAKTLPLYNLNPNKLLESVESIIQDRKNWIKRGKRSREFVEKWHEPLKLQEIIFEKYSK